jgi:hypothetical protein
MILGGETGVKQPRDDAEAGLWSGARHAAAAMAAGGAGSPAMLATPPQGCAESIPL